MSQLFPSQSFAIYNITSPDFTQLHFLAATKSCQDLGQHLNPHEHFMHSCCQVVTLPLHQKTFGIIPLGTPSIFLFKDS
jgi:hypothetical protein